MQISSNEPKVSVIIPTFNRVKYLKETIDSVLKQTFTDFELIITDNCSSDGTPELVRSYNDSRIRYYRNDVNIGPVNNHNRALSLSQGKYISFFSDDDIMLEKNLELKVRILEENDDVGIIHSNLKSIDESGKIFRDEHWGAKGDQWSSITHSANMPGTQLYNILYYNWNFISMPTVIVRRNLLIEQGLQFNNLLVYLADWELWLRLAKVCSCYFLDEKLILYREHQNNETKKLSFEKYFIELLLIKLSLLNSSNEFGDSIYMKLKEILKTVKFQVEVPWLGFKPSFIRQKINYFKSILRNN